MTASQPSLIDAPGTPRRQFVEPHIAQWLADQTRHIDARRCRRCKADVLRGLDDEVAAFMITVDPAPLSALGEALALLAGRSTVACTNSGGLRFTRRSQWRITSRPAGSRHLDVYAEHVCGSAPLPEIPSTHMPITPAASAACPF